MSPALADFLPLSHRGHLVYDFLCERTFSFLLHIFIYIHLGVNLPGHVVMLFNFGGTAKIFFKSAVPFYIFTSNACGLQFLHILAHIFLSSLKKFYWVIIDLEWCRFQVYSKAN